MDFHDSRFPGLDIRCLPRLNGDIPEIVALLTGGGLDLNQPPSISGLTPQDIGTNVDPFKTKAASKIAGTETLPIRVAVWAKASAATPYKSADTRPGNAVCASFTPLFQFARPVVRLDHRDSGVYTCKYSYFKR
jgi:hypothetical protein